MQIKHIEQDIDLVHQMIHHNLLTNTLSSSTSNSDSSNEQNKAAASTTAGPGPEALEAQEEEQSVYVELGAGRGLMGLAVNW